MACGLPGNFLLTSTFRHIPGVGLKTEQRFWEAGIVSWDDFKEPLPLKLPAGKVAMINKYLERSRHELPANPFYFCELLKASQHWRLFPHYRHTTVYIDIETTGLDDACDHITTIVLYDGVDIKCYVYGENLDDFVGDIGKYDVVISYNGKSFDIPFVERFFGIKLHKAHIDLRYVLRSLGFSGGLKSCEQQLGLDRGDLAGVDGYFAVLLWQEYKKTGDRRTLETLLAYNIEDVVNLEWLMVEAYNLSLEHTPLSEEGRRLSPVVRPNSPFSADATVISRLMGRYVG